MGGRSASALALASGASDAWSPRMSPLRLVSNDDGVDALAELLVVLVELVKLHGNVCEQVGDSRIAPVGLVFCDAGLEGGARR